MNGMWKWLSGWRRAPSRPSRQVYGGPLDGTWTEHESLEGYILGRDQYSGRPYFVWREQPPAPREREWNPDLDWGLE